MLFENFNLSVNECRLWTLTSDTNHGMISSNEFKNDVRDIEVLVNMFILTRLEIRETKLYCLYELDVQIFDIFYVAIPLAMP